MGFVKQGSFQFLPKVWHSNEFLCGNRPAKISRLDCAGYHHPAPSPAMRESIPSNRLKALTTGMLPPERMKTGFVPNPCSIALVAACMNGLSNGRTNPGTAMHVD